ncbi:MAG: hypothetical protein WBV82_28055 [Myxococcaceae bacterium]
MPHCVACNRWVSARWRRCPWCRHWTGRLQKPGDAPLDSELRALAALGITAGFWISFFGTAFLDEQPTLGGGMILVGATLLSASGGLLVHKIGYGVALLTWGAVLAALSSNALEDPKSALLGCAVPALAILVFLLRWRQLNAHLSGDDVPRPPIVPHRFGPGRCERCGQPGASVRAPVWVASFGFIAVRNIGITREVCVRHGRLHALPATLATAIFGWWSIWGVFWTPHALYDNLLEGGTANTDLDMLNARQQSGWRHLAPPFAAIAGGLLFPVLAQKAWDHVVTSLT